MVIVTKFGGTSARDGPALEHLIKNILLENPQRRVAVVSAPSGITNKLREVANEYSERMEINENLLRDIEDRFLEIANHFRIDPSELSKYFSEMRKSVTQFDHHREKHLDLVSHFGERINSYLLFRAIQGFEVDSIRRTPLQLGMVGGGPYGGAHLDESSYANISSRLDQDLKSGKFVVVPGYYVLGPNKDVMTLSRGGSDLTGSIVAKAIKLSGNQVIYENWTDADGIMTADPREISGARTIPYLSFIVAREAAYSGAKILHSGTLIPLFEEDISLIVKNTSNPKFPGTYIANEPPQGLEIPNNGHSVQIITYTKDRFNFVYLTKMGMDDLRGYVARITEILESHGISFNQVTTGVDSLTIAINQNIPLNEVLDEISEKGLVNKKRGIEIKPDMVLICVAGESIDDAIGIYGRIGTMLGSKGISIGPMYESRQSVLMGVQASKAKEAVSVLHNEFFPK